MTTPFAITTDAAALVVSSISISVGSRQLQMGTAVTAITAKATAPEARFLTTEA